VHPSCVVMRSASRKFGERLAPFNAGAFAHLQKAGACSTDQISTESASHKRLLVLLVIPMEAAGG
jgi:hypothetical protein